MASSSRLIAEQRTTLMERSTLDKAEQFQGLLHTLSGPDYHAATASRHGQHGEFFYLSISWRCAGANEPL